MRDCCPVSVTAAIVEFQRARTSKKFTDNNKQRDALTTVQNSGKFSPIHNISINAIPICEKGNSDFARIMLLYGSEKHMNQRKECLT